MPFEPSTRPAVVRYERVASPVTRLQMLTPSFERSPSPLLARRTSSAASAGLLDTRNVWVSRSNQRKAGSPSLFPWRMPSWLADVIDGSRASHCDSLWVRPRTQDDIVVTDPARMRAAMI